MDEESGKGFLKRHEWILCLHIIKKTKIGFPVPSKIPSNLQQFIDDYENKHINPHTTFNSTTNY